jgi:GNAT superfamily N-acetyltransferase
MSDRIDIVEAVAEDAGQIRAFMAQVIRTSVTADENLLAETTGNVDRNVDIWLQEPGRCIHLAAWRAGELVGIVLVKDFWNLCSLFVAPALQRSGIGRLLVESAAKRCRGRSPKDALWLNAATDAVPFYRRLGFVPRQSTQPLPPGFQAMQRPLPDREDEERAAGPRPPLVPAVAREMAHGANARAAILVEGWSDQAAVDALARRRGTHLQAAGILTLPIGGVTNLPAFIEVLGASGLGLRLTVLCDAAEEGYARRVLDEAGPQAIGLFVCDADLEDELIRALGPAAVEAVIDAQGELASLHRFREQPAQRGRELHAQLRRFLGTRAGRKIRYGSLLVDAIDPARAPPALQRLIAHALEG